MRSSLLAMPVLLFLGGCSCGDRAAIRPDPVRPVPSGPTAAPGAAEVTAEPWPASYTGCEREPNAELLEVCGRGWAALVDGRVSPTVGGAIDRASDGSTLWRGYTEMATTPHADPRDNHGGALLAEDADVAVRCSHLRFNEAKGGGHAIAAVRSRLALLGSTVTDNETSDEGGWAVEVDAAPSTGPWFAEQPIATPDTAGLLVVDSELAENRSGVLHFDALQAKLEPYEVTIRDSRFRDNAGSAGLLRGGSLTIERTRFEGNRGPSHGALYVYATQDARLEDVVFEGNHAWADWGRGGALVLDFYHPYDVLDVERQVTIEGGRFVGNQADEYGAAILVHANPLVEDELHLVDVEVQSNRAGPEGAALQLVNAADPPFTLALEIEGGQFALNEPVDIRWREAVYQLAIGESIRTF